MREIFAALLGAILSLVCEVALAQSPGILPPGSVLGNTGASPAPASPITTTGTGNVVLSNSPVLPIILGGTGAASTLTLESTSGAGTSDAIRFLTGSQAEAARFDTSKNFLLGTTAAQTISGITPTVQLFTNGNANGFASFSYNNAFGGFLFLGGSRGVAPGTFSATQNGDPLGAVSFLGDTGSNYAGRAASVSSAAEGNFTTSSSPGNLKFNTTPSGSTATVERLRITSTAHVEFNHGSGTPTPSSCGTSPTISGTDTAGQIVTGTGSPTACTVTFAQAWTTAPYCTLSWTPNLASMSYTISTTAISITQTATSSNTIYYHCFR